MNQPPLNQPTLNQQPQLGVFPAETPGGGEVDLSIIIVSWNVWDLLRACLDSIEQVSRDVGAPATTRAFGPATSLATSKVLTVEVIVVDNASSDATAELLSARFPWV